MKAKINMKCHVPFSCLDGGDPLDIKVLFISYFVSDPDSESESEPESESIRSPKSEPEQPHHDSAPLMVPLKLVIWGPRTCGTPKAIVYGTLW